MSSLPSLLKSQKQIEIAQTAHKITKSAYIPNISLIAEDHLGTPITFELPPIDKNLNTCFIGLGLSYDISNLYKTFKHTNKTKTAISHAENDYLSAVEKSNANIYGAFVQYKNSFELYTTCQKSLELAQQNYSVTENRYKNYLALIIDLLDADNLQQDAQMKLVNAKINIIYHYYNLLYTSGRL